MIFYANLIQSPNNAIEARSKKYHNSTRDGGRSKGKEAEGK
jgi:hypothetical protein